LSKKLNRKYRVLLSALTIFLSLFLLIPAHAQVKGLPTFEDGKNYFERGDNAKSIKIFRRLAARGDERAEYYFGVMIDNGWGISKNASSAVNWIRRAANKDYLPALSYMGYAVSTGHGTGRKNQPEALKWYRKAAKMGDPVAQNNLATMLRKGIAHKKDYNLAAQWFLQAATQGNARAQYNLGNMYQRGQGVKVNYSEALRWYNYAAAQGDIYAAHALGDVYYKGLGVKKNSVTALYWYKRAAKKGHVKSMVAIAKMYEILDGGKNKGPADAIIWYKKAANKGSAEAMHWLGNLYEMGIGTKQNFRKAVKWYKKAGEENGFIPSLLSLARLYESGKGVPLNLEKASNIYKRMAELGDAESQFNLGRFYKNGLYVEVNLIEAYKWFSLAARGLSNSEMKADAIVARIEIANELSEEDLTRARNLANEWSAKNGNIGRISRNVRETKKAIFGRQ